MFGWSAERVLDLQGGISMTARYALIVWTLWLMVGCGQTTSPIAPTAPSPPAAAPTGPRYLLAGESNAFFLRDCCLQNAMNVIRVGSIDSWLASAEFAEKARSADLIAFLWWQGNGDSGTTPESYAARLRALIGIARGGNPTLPVRIIEIPDTHSRAAVREAQRQVGQDPGVVLIPTADLPLDANEHFLPAGYATVKDRVNQSLGR
jgi:hypothetical protein